jgi:putative transposase
VRYRFIKEQHDWHSVQALCRVMQVSRAGYYQWLTRKPCARVLADERLGRQLTALHHEYREAYGADRLCRELGKRGVLCSERRVARLKRNLALWTKRRRRFVFTRNADARHARYDNLLRCRFKVNQPNRVWAADVTCVWTLERWLYIAVVIDLYSRRVIGWSMGPNCKEDLTLAALQMALELRGPKSGLLHHSDRGVHYAGQRYQQLLRKHGIRASMNRPARCTDNAVVESFFSSLKNELTLHERYDTRAKARAAVFNYIELFYNRERQHSFLGYISPVEFERRKFTNPVSEKA